MNQIDIISGSKMVGNSALNKVFCAAG